MDERKNFYEAHPAVISRVVKDLTQAHNDLMEVAACHAGEPDRQRRILCTAEAILQRIEALLTYLD